MSPSFNHLLSATANSVYGYFFQTVKNTSSESSEDDRTGFLSKLPPAQKENKYVTIYQAIISRNIQISMDGTPFLKY